MSEIDRISSDWEVLKNEKIEEQSIDEDWEFIEDPNDINNYQIKNAIIDEN